MQHALDCAELRQSPGEILRDFSHMGDAQTHGLDAAQGELAFVWRDADAEAAQDLLHLLAQAQIGDRDRAQQQVGMAADIFGQRLAGEIGPMRQRLEDQWGRPGVVAADEHALRLGGRDDRRRVLHLHGAGARRLDPDQLRRGVDQSGDAGSDQRVVDDVVDAARPEIIGAKTPDRRIDMVRDQHLVARHQHGQHHDRDRRLSRGHEHGARAAMQRRQLRLQRARGRRAVQAIGIAVEAAIFPGREARRILVDDGRGPMRRHREGGIALLGDGGVMNAAGGIVHGGLVKLSPR